MIKHGGYFGKDKEDIIDFSVNINPLGVPFLLKEKLRKSIENLESYPEIDGRSGISILSNQLDVSADNIILGNGATELIYLFARTFKAKKVLIVEPTFTEYERAFALADSQIHHFETSRDENFKVNIQSLIEAIDSKRPGVLVMCNPNNPTGTFTRKKELVPLLDILKYTNTKLFIDESFIDFTSQESYVELIDEYDIFLLRSMTKIYSIPGLRLGFGLANGETIKQLNNNKEPWTINSLALDSIEVLLKDKFYKDQTNMWYSNEKERFKRALREISSIKVYESEANFFLCRLNNLDANHLRDYLIKKGIYIRTCEDFYGLDSSFIRLAVRTREENMKLVTELIRYFI